MCNGAFCLQLPVERLAPKRLHGTLAAASRPRSLGKVLERGHFVSQQVSGFCGLVAAGIARKRRLAKRQGLHATGLPVLLLHDLQDKEKGCQNQRNYDLLKKRLTVLLSWAYPMAGSELKIIELRKVGTKSMVPALMPEHAKFEDAVSVVYMKNGHSAVVTTAAAPRALVCSGVLEQVLYPCHDLLREGVSHVGLVPQLCGASGRAGELSRARTSSHLEEVLGVKVLESLKAAAKWLLPDGPAFTQPAVLPLTDVSMTVQSSDGTQLSDDQSLIISLLLPQNVSSISLQKIGKGWTSALKFFCSPLVGSFAEATGAMTFIKMGKAEDLEEELSVTQRMMELLGGFCPQILSYAEHGDLGAMHLSVANLSDGQPQGFADLYHELMLAPEAGNSLERLQGAVDFVFDHLIYRLQSAKSRRLVTFSAADELGFCRDIGGLTGTEKGLHVRTAYLLPKIWRKSPGDGSLASSVRKHLCQIMGSEAAGEESLRFLAGNPLELPNVCSSFLDDSPTLAALRESTSYGHRLCYSHGDLHGDNIMIDNKDNRFLIDFGKTGLGHALEDVTYLESTVILSYTLVEDDEDLSDALRLVPILAPCGGLASALAASDPELLESQVESMRLRPRVEAMFAIVKRIRGHLARQIKDLASVSPGRLEDELNQACRIAALLLLRNALFFMAARENCQQPRRRRLALAFACAYADAVKHSL